LSGILLTIFSHTRAKFALLVKAILMKFETETPENQGQKQSLQEAVIPAVSPKRNPARKPV
jgi:hypothetical protein